MGVFNYFTWIASTVKWLKKKHWLGNVPFVLLRPQIQLCINNYNKLALCICLQNKNAVLLLGFQVEKPCSTKPQELLLYPAKETSPIAPHSAATPPAHDKSPIHHKKLRLKDHLPLPNQALPHPLGIYHLTSSRSLESCSWNTAVACGPTLCPNCIRTHINVNYRSLCWTTSPCFQIYARLTTPCQTTPKEPFCMQK